MLSVLDDRDIDYQQNTNLAFFFFNKNLRRNNEGEFGHH